MKMLLYIGMPMVFNGAGPAEILNRLGIGYKWNSIDDLVNQFIVFDELEKNIHIKH
jgi:hypothetical protein